MADISASMVMDLRQRTGLGMMECKKALTDAAGDMTKAEELLRIRSGAKASKAADRIAAEGVIGLHVWPGAVTAAMVEVNCETDFVAKNDDFKAFASEVAQTIVRDNPADVAALANAKLASGDTVEARRIVLVQKIGENISLRRFARREAKGRIASYVHGARIGVIVDVTGGADTLGKDLALHIALGCPRHRRDAPNFVLVLHREILGGLRPRILSLLHFCLRDLLNPRPGAMPHQSLEMPLIRSGRAADQK